MWLKPAAFELQATPNQQATSVRVSAWPADPSPSCTGGPPRPSTPESVCASVQTPFSTALLLTAVCGDRRYSALPDRRGLAGGGMGGCGRAPAGRYRARPISVGAPFKHLRPGPAPLYDRTGPPARAVYGPKQPVALSHRLCTTRYLSGRSGSIGPTDGPSDREREEGAAATLGVGASVQTPFSTALLLTAVCGDRRYSALPDRRGLAGGGMGGCGRAPAGRYRARPISVGAPFKHLRPGPAPLYDRTGPPARAVYGPKQPVALSHRLCTTRYLSGRSGSIGPTDGPSDREREEGAAATLGVGASVQDSFSYCTVVDGRLRR